MPEPKISRRCPACRASIRDSAFFCPQCGDKLDPPKSTREPKPGIHDTEEVIVGNATLTEADVNVLAEERKGPTEVETTPARHGALGEVSSRIQKVTTRARDVEGDVKQRVQKFRDLSSVVIDEAGYDPSLRFVLVAAALFVLFLVIVLLNKFIG